MGVLGMLGGSYGLTAGIPKAAKSAGPKSGPGSVCLTGVKLRSEVSGEPSPQLFQLLCGCVTWFVQASVGHW